MQLGVVFLLPVLSLLLPKCTSAVYPPLLSMQCPGELVNWRGIFGKSADTANVEAEGRDGYKKKCSYDVFHIFSLLTFLTSIFVTVITITNNNNLNNNNNNNNNNVNMGTGRFMNSKPMSDDELEELIFD